MWHYPLNLNVSKLDHRISNSEWKHTSSVNRKDNSTKTETSTAKPYVTCSPNLADSSSTLNCDDYENWVCPACPELTDSEYDLVNKIVEKICLRWVCPVCKASPQSASHHGASAAEIKPIMHNVLITLVQSINQSIPYESLRTEQTTIHEKVNVVESSLVSRCSTDDA